VLELAAAALAEVLTRLPETPSAFVAWLDRFRGSPPHLRSAIAPGGPAWVELKVVLDAMTLFGARVDSTTATFATPGGAVVIGFGPASDGTTVLRSSDSVSVNSGIGASSVRKS
jgi:hypothetical protein